MMLENTLAILKQGKMMYKQKLVLKQFYRTTNWQLSLYSETTATPFNETTNTVKEMSFNETTNIV